MAYTAIEKMRRKNEERFGRDVGPFQPPSYRAEGKGNDLKSAALRMLRERCEELLFDPAVTAEEERTGKLQGTSLRAGQIPYDMQRDLDRLCLEKALESFIDSGTAEDAYTVYYCYLEMFIGRYGNSKKMVELLSEYESNGSSLLMKHRDHYSHSVYVFALGLAVYETNAAFRRIFADFYTPGEDDGNITANRFVELWGLTALFHDIGYPFEIPFEQVLSYFEVEDRERGEGSLFPAYQNVGFLTALTEDAQTHFEALYGRHFSSASELLAHDIADKLGPSYGFSEAYLLDVLERKPTHPEQFGYYMDHAFFSAVRLYAELAKELGTVRLKKEHVDALSAIILHNSLFKFSIAFYKSEKKRRPPLRAELHPLAWMLMLCDELQCWDRTAYGRNSRTELHPLAADFDFSDGSLSAVYYFDPAEKGKIDAFHAKYMDWEKNGGKGKPPRLKAYSDIAEKEQRFAADIAKIVDTGILPLHVEPGLRTADRRSKHVYLSGSSFLHLYDFAVALNGRRLSPDTPAAELESQFAERSLEYQLSSIDRAKSFGRYLNAIDCFYTDRPVDFEMVESFTPRQMDIIAPLEHERWIREHLAMGWRFGTSYETLPIDIAPEKEKEERAALREQLRCHKLAMNGAPSDEEIRSHFFSLPESEQDKDWKPFNSMLGLLKKFDGLRIYRL